MPSPGTFLGLQPLGITWRKWKFILNKSFIYKKCCFFFLSFSFLLSLIFFSCFGFSTNFSLYFSFPGFLHECFGGSVFLSLVSLYDVFLSLVLLSWIFLCFMSFLFFFLCVFDLASSLFIFTFFYIPISSSHYLFISQLYYKGSQTIIFILVHISLLHVVSLSLI